MRKGLWLIGAPFALATITLILVLTGCQSQQGQNWKPARRNIVVYSFSVEEEVMTKEIFPAFKAYWQRKTGEDVLFRSVFTGSEEIAGAILGGAAADIAILSNEQHAVWLYINDYVQTDWHDFPNQGVISRSPLVIVVRPGNPLGIKDWADLTRPGVRLVHANPRSSGGAQWALLAEYGSALEAGGEREAAEKQLRDIWANVNSSPPSSREALRQFLFGVGDALVTYEQDALLAHSRGGSIEIITPRSTTMSEHVVVIVDRNVSRGEQELMNAFVAFLWSETAQEAFGRFYFRPVSDEALDSMRELGVSDFPEVERAFTVQDLGGWREVYPEIIQGVWEEQIAPHMNSILTGDN